LAKEIGSVDRIASLEIATTARGYEQAGRDREKWTPRTRDKADHSLPYLTTRALVGGRIITRQVNDMPGFPGQPTSRAGMGRKFRSNAGTRWPASQVDELLQALWSFERTEDLRALLARLSLTV
jgi:2-methylcitrate dehydratase